MKLRIKGSTLRFRLSQTEVDQLSKGQPIQETVFFGKENIFKYILAPDGEEKELNATYEKDTIKVTVPQKTLNQWHENDEDVGFDKTVNFLEGTSLYILIEKDYKCLDVREEDESDLFENPNAGKNC